MMCDLTGSGKIQDGGLITSFACISASRQGNQQDKTEIPSAKPTLLRSSIPLGLMGILCDQTGSGKTQFYLPPTRFIPARAEQDLEHYIHNKLVNVATHFTDLARMEA